MTKREKSSFYSSDFWTKEEFLDSAVLRCVIYVITHSTSSWILAFLFSSCLPFCKKKEPQAPADANNMLHHRAPPNIAGPNASHPIRQLSRSTVFDRFRGFVYLSTWKLRGRVAHILPPFGVGIVQLPRSFPHYSLGWPFENLCGNFLLK